MTMTHKIALRHSRGNPSQQRHLKTVVLTDTTSTYAPTLLLTIAQTSNIDVCAIFARSLKSSRSLILEAVKRSGYRYVVSRTQALLRIRLSSWVQEALQKRPPIKVNVPSLKLVSATLPAPIVSMENINSAEIIARVRQYNPDIILSLFFGQILSAESLHQLQDSIIINIHPSILPSYAGMNPIFWAMANGEKETGVTAHIIDKEIDSGPIMCQEHIPIPPNESHHVLYRRIAEIGGKMTGAMLNDLALRGYHIAYSQTTEGRSYFSHPTSAAFKQFLKRGYRFF